MNKWTPWLLVLLISLVPLLVGAQSEISSLGDVQVDLWPDLDRAAVLVLITARLPAEATYPVTVRVALPVKPYAVAYVTADEQMLNAPFETLSEDEFYLIEIEAAEPTLRIEYYFAYNREGEDVSFTYQWLSGNAVDELILMFREPSLATAVDPDDRFEDVGLFPDGRRYYRWEVGAVGADETITADFAYVAPLPVVSSTSTEASTAVVDGESNSTLPIILAGAGGLLLGAGVGWVFSRQRRTVHRAPQMVKAPQSTFCHQCGTRQRSGDVFCRQCGTRLR